MLLILSQRRLKFENLKLDLLDFLESGDVAVIDFVVHHVDRSHEEEEGTADLKPMNRQCVQVPEAIAPEERQGTGKEDEHVRREFIPAKRSCVLRHQRGGLFTIGGEVFRLRQGREQAFTQVIRLLCDVSLLRESVSFAVWRSECGI